MKKRIKNFEIYTKVGHFGNGFTQWTNGDLAHSAIVCVDDDYMTRNLVRSAFIAYERGFKGVCFSRNDASNMGLDY